MSSNLCQPSTNEAPIDLPAGWVIHGIATVLETPGFMNLGSLGSCRVHVCFVKLRHRPPKKIGPLQKTIFSSMDSLFWLFENPAPQSLMLEHWCILMARSGAHCRTTHLRAMAQMFFLHFSMVSGMNKETWTTNRNSPSLQVYHGLPTGNNIYRNLYSLSAFLKTGWFLAQGFCHVEDMCNSQVPF